MTAALRAMRAVRRIAALVLLLCAVASGWFVVYGGRALQHEDPLQRADAIFVLAGTRAERPLEAVELYRAGYAPYIVLSPGRPEPSEFWLWQRGIAFPSDSAMIRDVMIQLGVPAPAIVIAGRTIDNTAEEAIRLRNLARDRGWHKVIIVTSKYHTRRAGFAFRRALKGTGIEPLIRASRYDMSDPANWWRRRGDIRFAGSEWIKLVLYWLGLGA
jgi:uncharacterized SAM-binding protein YcdF (DUF218 family)